MKPVLRYCRYCDKWNRVEEDHDFCKLRYELNVKKILESIRRLNIMSFSTAPSYWDRIKNWLIGD